MRTGPIAISVLAMGCWTSAPVPTSPPEHGRQPTTSSVNALASELADVLREPEDSMFIARFIDRQFVVLEKESANVQVLCDAQTLIAAVRFSELLNDPDRPPARCSTGATGSSAFICVQGSGAGQLRLDFVRIEDGWLLIGGILPRGPAPATGDGAALVREYRAKLGIPSCPP